MKGKYEIKEEITSNRCLKKRPGYYKCLVSSADHHIFSFVYYEFTIPEIIFRSNK